MGYSHCDGHDEDATNGCRSCDQEEIDSTSDYNVIRRASHNFRDDDLMRDRLLAIADAMELMSLKERQEELSASLASIEKRLKEMP
jgi:hypothetical protein